MKPNFHKKILKNGMAILFEKRDIPVVSVAFAVGCGGVNEALNEKGISHFIEHMLYKGTQKRNSKQISEEIEKNGGELNGFTGEIITAFHCKMPSKHLSTALDVLGDIMKNSLFDEKEVEKERKVIFEELKMRKDNPMQYVFDKMQEILYESPFGKIDSEETMISLTQKKLVKRFKEIYSPNNLILCVVGDGNFEDIVRFAEKNFGDEKSKIPEFKIKIKNESKIEKRKGIDQANLILAYHTPLSTDKKNHAANVLNTLLAGGMSSRLFIEIRAKRNLAYSVHGGGTSTKNYAYNYIYVGTSKENVGKVKKLILEEFEKISKKLGEKELKQVKEQLIGNHQIGMEASQDQMAHLLYYEIDSDAKNLYEFEKNIKEVKLEDVKNLAKLKDYSFFALVPE